MPDVAVPPLAAPRAGTPRRSPARTLLSRVPEVTLFFWIIKILATTVGETAADNLDSTFSLGLTNLTAIMGSVLAAALVVQFRLKRYVPGVYWLCVVLISIVGTLITDNMTDNLAVPLEVSTAVFSVALAVTFGAWYAKEGTLSIHSIVTGRREAFYWLAILFTFVLGTAAGDLVAERAGLGFLVSAISFASIIAAVAIAHLRFGLNAVLAFWVAYILTRPLGASLGDWLSQPRADGGLALGTTGTSVLFLAAILGVVTYLTVSRKDRIAVEVA